MPIVPDRSLAVSAGLRDRLREALTAPGSGRLLTRWLLATAAFGVVLVIGDVAGVPLSDLTRDPNGITEEPAYLGAISTLGLVGWGAAAALCAVTASVLDGSRRSRYLVGTAALLLVLLLDDGLLLHERVLPDAGISEKVVYLVLAGLVLAWAAMFWREIVRVDLLLLLLAGGSLAASLAVDALDLGPNALEDAAKVVGIASIFAYAVRETRRVLRSRMDE